MGELKAKRMDLRQFRDLGVLMAVNLEVLHPIGLALALTQDTDGSISEVYVVEALDDPAGIVFDGDLVRSPSFLETRLKFLRFRNQRLEQRELTYGDVQQIVPGRYCYLCGCTDEQACPGGCSWYLLPDENTGEPGVCDACVDDESEEPEA